MRCFRCGAAMYRVVNKDQSAKATCTGCSQWIDCAKCSSPNCGDVKCLACYNKRPTTLTPGAIVPDDQEA
jgi:hypothetical protein